MNLVALTFFFTCYRSSIKCEQSFAVLEELELGRINTSIDTQNSTVQLPIFEMTFTNDGNEAAVRNLDLNATLSMSLSISANRAYIGGRFSSARPCIEGMNSLITCRVYWLIIAAQRYVAIVKSLVSRISIRVEKISLNLLHCGFKFLKDRCSFG